MAERLATLKGSFVLSINDTPQIRKVFAAFESQQVDVTYTANDTDAVRAKELIILPAG